MYTDIESKIKANKEALGFYLERNEKISSNYPFYLIYVSFIGVYIFDFISKCIEIIKSESISQSAIFLIAFGLATICIIVSFIYFISIFIPKKTAHDFLPREVYIDYRNDIKEWVENQNNKKLNIDDELKKSYLETLKNSVEANFILYTRKRKLYFRTIIWALISIIPYILSIIIFKTSFNMGSPPENIINIFL